LARIRTLRGRTVVNGDVIRLIVDDGQFTHGYKVLGFQVLAVDPTSSTADCVGTLALSPSGADRWDLSDNRQIAWAGQTMYGSSSPFPNMATIDPDHIVVRDLWVWGFGTTADPGYQYLVTLEEVTITEDHAVLQLIKEVSQDV
jgi:hypothetical protein